MSNPFEKFGIKHLSPSSLNLWNANPGLWSLRYLGGMRDPMGPGAWRGSGVGEGFADFLLNKDREKASSVAGQRFDKEKGSQDDPRILKELAVIDPMLDVLIAHSAGFKEQIKEAEVRVSHEFEGLAVPVIGYIDLDFDQHFVEIKTTMRVPTSPKEDHVRQVALYRAAHKKPGTILYTSDKKCVEFPIGDNAAARALSELRRDAMSLQNFLATCETPECAIKSLPMNTADFRWSETATTKLEEYA